MHEDGMRGQAVRGTLKMLAAVVAAALLLFVATVATTAGYLYLRQDPQKLYRAIANADTMTITRNNVDSKVLYRTHARRTIAAFAKAAATHRRFMLALPSCRGTFGINFYRNGRQVAALAYLPNGDLREDLIEHVGYLGVDDPQALRRWIDEHVNGGVGHIEQGER